MSQPQQAAGGRTLLGAAAAGDSSGEDDDGAPRGNMERVPSFDLDAADAGAGSGAAAAGLGGGGPPRRFDPNTTAQHRYLGDVDELGGGSQLLEEGRTYTLPLFPLDGVVLLPGDSLPMFLHSPHDILKLERALRLPPGDPTARLIAVTHESSGYHTSLVGCSAEIRRLRRRNDNQQQQQQQQQQQRQQRQQRQPGEGGAAGGGGPGVVALMARGRQRLQLEGSGLWDTFRVRCRVLPEGLAEAPPRQMSAGATFWAPWAARPFDAPALAGRVQQLCSGVLPQIAGKMSYTPSGNRGPIALQRYSYWLASNLPLSADRRQQLLECRDAAERLRLMLGWLTKLGTLACSVCDSPVARCSSALLMNSEGAGGAFVNAHGFVHDIATFRAVQGLSYQGHPETAHSWFPGYAWTIAHCAHCGEHLGWRFTACSGALQPAVFWGLRRAAIACPHLQQQQQLRIQRAAAAAVSWARAMGRRQEAAADDDDDDRVVGRPWQDIVREIGERGVADLVAAAAIDDDDGEEEGELTMSGGSDDDDNDDGGGEAGEEVDEEEDDESGEEGVVGEEEGEAERGPEGYDEASTGTAEEEEEG